MCPRECPRSPRLSWADRCRASYVTCCCGSMSCKTYGLRNRPPSPHGGRSCTLYGCILAACWISWRRSLADRSGLGDLSPSGANSACSPTSITSLAPQADRDRERESPGVLGGRLNPQTYRQANSDRQDRSSHRRSPVEPACRCRRGRRWYANLCRQP